MTEVGAETELVATEKLAVVAPTLTVTLAGTVATEVLLLESDTAAPPFGAAPVRVTVPWEGEPPITDVGLSVTFDKPGAGGEGGFTYNWPLLVLPP